MMENSGGIGIRKEGQLLDGLNKQGGSICIGRGRGYSAMAISLGDVSRGNEASEIIYSLRIKFMYIDDLYPLVKQYAYFRLHISFLIFRLFLYSRFLSASCMIYKGQKKISTIYITRGLEGIYL